MGAVGKARRVVSANLKLLPSGRRDNGGPFIALAGDRVLQVGVTAGQGKERGGVFVALGDAAADAIAGVTEEIIAQRPCVVFDGASPADEMAAATVKVSAKIRALSRRVRESVVIGEEPAPDRARTRASDVIDRNTIFSSAGDDSDMRDTAPRRRQA
jgi:hypothetical protein